MARFFLKHFTLRRIQMIGQEGDFLSRISELLDEGYTIHDAIMILLPHHTTELQKARNITQETFRNGKGTAEVLEAFGINQHRLLPIAIAEEHGRLASAVKAVAEQLKRQEVLKTKAKKLLAYPIILFIFMAILFSMFRIFFLPNMRQLGESRSSTGVDDFATISEMLLKVPDILILTMIFSVSISLLSWKWLNTKSAKERLKTLLMIPGVSYWVKMLITSSFAREVGTMIQSGMSLQDSLETLRRQMNQTFLQVVSEKVRRKIVEGEKLSKAVQMEAFVSDFHSFIEHGEYGGHLGKEMIIYSQLLEEKMEQVSLRILGILQPLLFSILAICILSAYLAILLPMYELLNTI
ncbi:competence type IV pilus assembly protein ComGB [Chungangia koreensis]|uniref:Competence type IV pilus assembly protein ComGB n=1 Tax=Chungangia koreensis TaxID=752657 RepID=A0ABV8X849_9LACT